MFTIIRNAIAVFSIIIAILIVVHTGAKKKKWVYVIIFCGAGLLYYLTCYLPIENVVAPFSSPEEAFHYRLPYEEALGVSEGKDSAIVMGEYNTMAVKRLRNGWGLFSCSRIGDTYKKVTGQSVSSTISYAILRVPWTSDYYLNVWSAQESFTVEDSIKSEIFYYINDIGGTGYTKIHYAWCHLDRIEADYCVFINGKEIHPFEELKSD